MTSYCTEKAKATLHQLSGGQQQGSKIGTKMPMSVTWSHMATQSPWQDLRPLLGKVNQTLFSANVINSQQKHGVHSP